MSERALFGLLTVTQHLGGERRGTGGGMGRQDAGAGLVDNEIRS